jgi:GNAT superfamily N-acetyltransferase
LIEFRTFRNDDPPKILRLWQTCELGRGAAVDFNCDALDYVVFSQPYFDRAGLIVATEGDEVVGYVHAGFGANEPETAISTDRGVICAVMVRPEFRRQGIGRQLVRKAEEYLLQRGVREIYAGEHGRLTPFYLGLYGASESVGFLESDAAVHPFLKAVGYLPAARYLVFRRDITQKNEPFDARVIGLRKKVQFGLIDHPIQAKWWWMTRIGRFDSLSFVELPVSTPDVLAQVTCWSMDFQSVGWRQRTVGLHELFVPEPHRRKAHAKTLLLEVFRRMRDELIAQIDFACVDDYGPGLALARKLGFEELDAGVVYRLA